MESQSGLSTTTVEAPPLAPGTRRINFLDLPSEVKNLIYFYRDRTKRAIDLCVLSPAWKSPSPPTAFMNTCSAIASGLMPLYFSNCLFTIDTTHKVNAQLLEAAFKWLKKVGDKSSAHFRRLHIIKVSSLGSRFEVTVRSSVRHGNKDRKIPLRTAVSFSALYQNARCYSIPNAHPLRAHFLCTLIGKFP
ncbi:hypothetical protein KCU77_g4603, partial [Aureobasidium melanogenum]